MGGISSSIPIQNQFFPLEILVTEKAYRIVTQDFSRTATESELQNFTKGILNCFYDIERTINKTKQLQLSPEQCNQYLMELAVWGRRAYQKFFNDDAQKATYQYSQLLNKLAPIFISEEVTFPWEILYEGDTEKISLDKIWGFNYPVARRLNLKQSNFLSEQLSPLDMLFCLHHKLLQAHKHEKPEIEKIVRAMKGKFYLLELSKEKPIKNGISFLKHLYQTQHNILHFACHCRACKQYADEIDALVISIIEGDSSAGEIELETYNFLDVSGSFQCQPLIFLNACQSAGGFDDLRKTFNLPKEFIQRGAAAVIATACPVPDLFAAAFAQQFYKYFINQKMMIGEALCETRRYFLEKYNNPLGLAYGLYSSPYYKIAQKPGAVRINL